MTGLSKKLEDALVYAWLLQNAGSIDRNTFVEFSGKVCQMNLYRERSQELKILGSWRFGTHWKIGADELFHLFDNCCKVLADKGMGTHENESFAILKQGLCTCLHVCLMTYDASLLALSQVQCKNLSSITLMRHPDANLTT